MKPEIKDYVEHEYSCPKCAIEGDLVEGQDFEDDFVFNLYRCPNCRTLWREHWQLTKVEIILE